MRGEVRLGQTCCLLSRLYVGTDLFSDIPRQRCDTFNTLIHRAELDVEGGALELVQPGVEIAGAIVFVPEEDAVRQARRQDLGIAALDFRAAVDGLHIGREQEVRRHLAVLATHGEVLLVRAHRGLDDFRRQGQETRVHVAQQRHGIFVEAGDLFEQAVVLDQFAAGVGTEIARGFGDDVLAHLVVQHDEVVGQGLFIAEEVADSERLTRAQETMAFALVAGQRGLRARTE